jgi:hypothetical protein
MPGDFHSSIQIRRTRKPHQCYWCAETIDAGSAAVSHSCRHFFNGGEFNSYYLHPECDAASKREDTDGDGWEPLNHPRGMTWKEFDACTDEVEAEERRAGPASQAAA